MRLSCLTEHLRYLLWIAALLTPRPPGLLVLNEPETSLHPDLLPALGRLIASAAERSQVLVVTHAPKLIEALEEQDDCNSVDAGKRVWRNEDRGRGRARHSRLALGATVNFAFFASFFAPLRENLSELTKKLK